MGLPNRIPDTLPCKCSNPNCGITFYAKNPVGGSGKNIYFAGNLTNCPSCMQTAHYIDWSIDSKGTFNLNGFFSALRGFEDVSKLQTLKIDLEAANDTITAHELADALVELEPSFDKFKNVLSSLPVDKISIFINTVITMISLIIMLQTMQSGNDNHDESIALQQEQHNLALEKFEYQKEQDIKQQDNNSVIKYEQDILKNKIELLQKEFEDKLNKIEQSHLNTNTLPNSNKSLKLKGNCRNKPCPCGSSKKAKKCHPNGYLI